MRIEINEDELRDWVIKQIQKRMGDRINSLMREWDWNSYMQEAVDKVVTEKVTDETIKSIVGSIDKNMVIKTVSEHIAIEISDSFLN